MRLARLVHGPFVGLATLHAWCPTVSRRAIAAWRRRDRRQCRQRRAVLRWTQPGRVWAMDFSDPPQPIAGGGDTLLHVRDLARPPHLAAQPAARATAAAACDLLRALCATHDAPLVLKIDNGAACVSRALQAWAAGVGTVLLYSPPCCPRYNGGIEASIGALTMRTHLAAAAAGHPEYWTCEDLAAATAAPAPSVPPITRAERRRFLAHYQTAITAGDHHAPMALQHRTAIVHTLQDLGYVSITRRADIVHPLTAQKRKRFRT